MKKILSLLLAVGLITTMLVSCDSEKEDIEDENKVYEITSYKYSEDIPVEKVYEYYSENYDENKAWLTYNLEPSGRENVDYSKYIYKNISEFLDDFNYTKEDLITNNMGGMYELPGTDKFAGHDFNVQLWCDYSGETIDTIYEYEYNNIFFDIEESISTMEDVCKNIDQIYGDSVYYNCGNYQFKDYDKEALAEEMLNEKYLTTYAIWETEENDTEYGDDDYQVSIALAELDSRDYGKEVVLTISCYTTDFYRLMDEDYRS